MTNSILLSMKESLGITPEYAPFDQELILHMNSIFTDLNQLGVGPDAGYSITSDAEVWDDYISVDQDLFNNVKSYMVLRLKMLFDPPSVGYVLTAMEKQIEKAEWRINVMREDLTHPYVPPVVDTSTDPFV